jgi:hypothetical protein
MSDFTGDWQTTYGPMTLKQQGKRVQGSYRYLDSECRIEGKIGNGKLVFTYHEPQVHGEGWLSLTRRNHAFTGQFHEAGSDRWGSWDGERIGYDGLWNTTFGLMRLIEEDGRIRGFYEVGGGGTIDGHRTGSRLVFRYREPATRGRGRFELAGDGLSFQGEWKPHSDPAWRPWSGTRVRPQPNLSWLVVIEAPWQRFLSDREYSFGNMLREFFARVPHVQVRQRFFSNEAGLRKCLRDLLYIAEPVILSLASHAQPDGISVNGQTIGVPTLLDELRCAGNLQLVHFSACLLMQDPAVVDQLRTFARQVRVPISGYRTSVDWGASAIIEFTYFDLILSRGLTPSAAAAQLLKLLPFAGERAAADAPFKPAGFSIVLPDDPAKAKLIRA